ncbi:MAG: fasciclin domain-containing protein [Solirubrobacterales bacterium]|nr:fasciclin domain-containing protein [Solirubrobacterales bacterium]
MNSIKRCIAALATLAAVSVAVLAPATSAASSQGNIVQTAAAAGQFKTLIKLAGIAGLAGSLEGKGPLTVFAPTDAAFAKLPQATVTALEHNRAELRAVLLYHVVKGRITAAQLVKRHSVKTLNGQSLTVRVKNGVVTVGGVRVIKTNIAASNGVIYVINGVLIPR